MGRKRSNGEGSITKRSNGTWRGQLMVGYNDDGSPRRVNFSGKTKAEVLDKIRDYKNKADAKLSDASNLTFSAWADTWYQNYETQVQASTYDGYKYTLKLLKEGLGGKKLQSIILMDVNAFLDNLRQRNYSMSAIRKCRAMLLQIFDYAEDNNLIMRNPAQRSKLMKSQSEDLFSVSDDKDAFTDEEVAILEKELSNDLLGNSILFMIYSGIRTQELLALTISDIAEDGSSVTVNKAIKTVKGKPTIGPPKSKSSYRQIPIPEDKRKYALYLREHAKHDLIWSHSGDKPYGVGSFRRRYYTAIKPLPVRKLTPHCCRHTYVTRLQAKGVPLEVIAKLVGHSEIKTTGVYLHTAFPTLQDAVTVLNK